MAKIMGRVVQPIYVRADYEGGPTAGEGEAQQYRLRRPTVGFSSSTAGKRRGGAASEGGEDRTSTWSRLPPVSFRRRPYTAPQSEPRDAFRRLRSMPLIWSRNFPSAPVGVPRSPIRLCRRTLLIIFWSLPCERMAAPFGFLVSSLGQWIPEVWGAVGSVNFLWIGV